MEIENLIKLIETVSASELTGMKYEENGMKLHLTKKKEQIHVVAASGTNMYSSEDGASVMSLAPQAAGKIHSDFERGFIRAEVVNYQDLLDCGAYAAAREKGLVRLEGKDYVVQDGDVILFRFNV